MRFDDRLETALKQAHDGGNGIEAKWQQLIDLLAQNPKKFAMESVAEGLLEARLLMPEVNVETRLACVTALAGRIQSAPLVQLLAADVPPVAAAAISGARLSDAEWSDIVPHLPVRARGFLRNQMDIGPETRRALTVWSSADFILPLPEGIGRFQTAETVDPVGNTQIRDIVERIENLRRNREMEAPLLPLEGGEYLEFSEPIHEIRFETDENGTVSWVEGAPRGAIVGVDIAEPAFDTGPGPDAYGAAAFRQRMSMENARMRLCGPPAVEGDWRINASPFFDPLNGRFNGYRGIFRRPTLAESAQIESPSTGSDQMQQLVHELRTPLGAIIGFSEIIEQQLFGPVSYDYRILARNILNDAERLLAGFDDLAMAAKIESGHFSATPGTTECGWLANRLAERLRGLSDLLNVTLNLTHAHPVRAFAIDNELAERMFSRLLSAVIIGCEAGEELNGRFRTEPGRNATNRFVLTLPHKLRTMDEVGLFGSGPGAHDDIDEAPLLGLGFSLRLVRSLARNVRGDLRFYNEALILSIPATQDSHFNYRDEERE
ncbi:MAG: histidine kinase dimerization/phospho-acceptor domain-containing protein [Sphingorhabdus sp.]